jgi:hypothetical protein
MEHIPIDVDPSVPALETLLGDAAGSLLGGVLAEAGGRVHGRSISQVRYVPGRSVTVHYRVDVAWGDAEPTRELLVAAAGIPVPSDTPVFAADGVEVAVWRFPNDPFLPGLHIVADAERASGLLGQLGAPGHVSEVRTRAYRAGRRAVVELTTHGVKVFVKVVRPGRAERLHDKHVWLSTHVPVPLSLGWSADHGLVALQAIPGRTLRAALEAGSRRVPGPDSLVGLLDRLPAADPDGDTVAGPRTRVAEHARLLSAVAPGLGGRIAAIVECLQADPAPDLDPVHGDYHTSQVLTDGERITGLVDVDTAGAGSRIDDLASLLAHLATLSSTSSAKAEMDRYGAGLMAAFDRMVDPVELRLRTAAAVFGLATGPFRVQLPRWREDTERRVALAEQWVRSAERAG